jgi:hypothetical protein
LVFHVGRRLRIILGAAVTEAWHCSVYEGKSPHDIAFDIFASSRIIYIAHAIGFRFGVSCVAVESETYGMSDIYDS